MTGEADRRLRGFHIGDIPLSSARASSSVSSGPDFLAPRLLLAAADFNFGRRLFSRRPARVCILDSSSISASLFLFFAFEGETLSSKSFIGEDPVAELLLLARSFLLEAASNVPMLAAVFLPFLMFLFLGVLLYQVLQLVGFEAPPAAPEEAEEVPEGQRYISVTRGDEVLIEVPENMLRSTPPQDG